MKNGNSFGKTWSIFKQLISNGFYDIRCVWCQFYFERAGLHFLSKVIRQKSKYRLPKNFPFWSQRVLLPDLYVFFSKWKCNCFEFFLPLFDMAQTVTNSKRKDRFRLINFFQSCFSLFFLITAHSCVIRRMP